MYIKYLYLYNMAQKTYFEIVTEVDENGVSRDYIVESTYDVDNETGERIGKIGDSVKLEDENGNFIETNLDRISIEPITKSDTLEDFGEKVDYNFSQLLMHGGGIKGEKGEQGIQGPQGYRGPSIFVFSSDNGVQWDAKKKDNEKVTEDDIYKDESALAKALKEIKNNPTNYIDGDIFILDSNICKIIASNNDEGAYIVTLDLDNRISIKGETGATGSAGSNGEGDGVWYKDEGVVTLGSDVSKLVLSDEYKGEAFDVDYESKLYFVNKPNDNRAHMSFVNDGKCDMIINSSSKNVKITPIHGTTLTIGNNDGSAPTKLVLKGGKKSYIDIDNNDNVGAAANKISLDCESFDANINNIKLGTNEIVVNDVLGLSKNSTSLKSNSVGINSDKITFGVSNNFGVTSKSYSIKTKSYSIDTENSNDSNISLTVNSDNRIILGKQGVSIKTDKFEIEKSGEFNIYTGNAKLQSDKDIKFNVGENIITINPVSSGKNALSFEGTSNQSKANGVYISGKCPNFGGNAGEKSVYISCDTIGTPSKPTDTSTANTGTGIFALDANGGILLKGPIKSSTDGQTSFSAKSSGVTNAIELKGVGSNTKTSNKGVGVYVEGSRIENNGNSPYGVVVKSTTIYKKDGNDAEKLGNILLDGNVSCIGGNIKIENGNEINTYVGGNSDYLNVCYSHGEGIVVGPYNNTGKYIKAGKLEIWGNSTINGDLSVDGNMFSIKDYGVLMTGNSNSTTHTITLSGDDAKKYNVIAFTASVYPKKDGDDLIINIKGLNPKKTYMLAIKLDFNDNSAYDSDLKIRLYKDTSYYDYTLMVHSNDHELHATLFAYDGIIY